ncbi:MAG: LysR family transcriptional regulator, partial [Anaerolineae bacterium]|nr:LysR family transcriptional regulator [Anaerolineae bacterium]
MSRLNYHHLYYFWRVAISGNLTQAARELHVSQSALSSQIRQLEDSMDTRLFERVSRRLVLTDAGQRVLAYAEDIFAKGEELESLLRRGVEPAYQHLRIGMLATMSRNFIEGFIEPLRDNPRVRFSLHAQGMASLLDGLATHQLDLVLTNTQVPVEDRSGPWQVQLLDRQPLALIGPPSLAFHSDFPHGFDSVRWVLPGPGA